MSLGVKPAAASLLTVADFHIHRADDAPARAQFITMHIIDIAHGVHKGRLTVDKHVV
jgi:hypothetical protein